MIELRNVLFLAEETRIGGAETYFYELERRINRERINLSSMAVKGEAFSQVSFPEKMTYYSFSPYSRVKHIRDFLLQNSTDVVHANSLQLAFCASVAIKSLGLSVPLVYTKHNLTKAEKVFPKLLPAFVNRNVDKIVSICKIDRDNLIEQGVKEDAITVINNGVDLSRHPFSPHYEFDQVFSGEGNVGILARLSKEKRHELFLMVAQELHLYYPNLKFYIGGDGPERMRLIRLSKDNRQTGYVSFLGNVDSGQFLEEMDFLFLVSEREVLPMSILEAMATGCVVVSGDVGGVRDIVSSDTGFLVPDDSVQSFVATFLEACKTNQQSRLMSARKFVEDNHSVITMVNHHEELYESL